MSRYASELRTDMSLEQAWSVAATYLDHKYFSLVDEGGDKVWIRQDGEMPPMFLKVVPRDGSVRIEAWFATAALWSWHSGEGYEGALNYGSRFWLEPHVRYLENALGEIVASGIIETPGTMPAAAHVGAPAPAAWYPDPTGLHQSRWWDGTNWTMYVSGARAT